MGLEQQSLCVASMQATAQQMPAQPPATFNSPVDNGFPARSCPGHRTTVITSLNSTTFRTPNFQKDSLYSIARCTTPGTVIIARCPQPNKQVIFSHWIQDQTHALRYGIGVGRDGFTWQGLLQIYRKAEWPDWRPPPEMIERQPYLPRFMAGGPGNPLGARAMYLGNTVYRIHGTNAPETIGQAVSSGCFRLVNDDVIDLYSRVGVGTHVIVRQD